MVPLMRCSLSRRLAMVALSMALHGATVAVAPAQGPAPSSAAAAPPLAAPFVPLDDAAYVYIDALMARGALHSLSALDRPYTTADLRVALSEEDESRFGAVLRGWHRALSEAVARHETRPASAEGAAVRVALEGIGTVETSARRELMRADDSSGAHPGLAARGALTAGAFVAGVRVELDQRLRDDPDFTGSKKRGVAGRLEEGYVAGRWRFGSIFLGRQPRSWGPWPLDGLQLGPYANSWDHLAATLGTRAVSLTGVVARLDAYAGGGDSGSYERHLALHRLRVRRGGFELALAEGVIYGGPGRGAELAYVNPLGLYQLAQYNETADGNVSYTADVVWRTRRAGSVAAQLLVDDLQIDRCSPSCAEPASLGLTISGEGLPLAGDHRWAASYTRVTNLTYRAAQPWEQWSSFGVGLGRGFSDYDEARIAADLAVVPWTPLRVYAAYRRQGEGDYRLSFPPTEDYPITPAFLTGRPERTLRLAVSGGVAWRMLDVKGDLGINRITDAEHVQGRRRTAFVGRVRGRLRLASLHVPL